jgi:hypothetical protein
LVEGDGLVGPV